MKLERWHGFVVWLIGSLLAIAWLGDALYFGLGIAVGSGVLFGLVNWRASRRARRSGSGN